LRCETPTHRNSKFPDRPVISATRKRHAGTKLLNYLAIIAIILEGPIKIATPDRSFPKLLAHRNSNVFAKNKPTIGKVIENCRKLMSRSVDPRCYRRFLGPCYTLHDDQSRGHPRGLNRVEGFLPSFMRTRGCLNSN